MAEINPAAASTNDNGGASVPNAQSWILVQHDEGIAAIERPETLALAIESLRQVLPASSVPLEQMHVKLRMPGLFGDEYATVQDAVWAYMIPHATQLRVDQHKASAPDLKDATPGHPTASIATPSSDDSDPNVSSRPAALACLTGQSVREAAESSDGQQNSSLARAPPPNQESSGSQEQAQRTAFGAIKTGSRILEAIARSQKLRREKEKPYFRPNLRPVQFVARSPSPPPPIPAPLRVQSTFSRVIRPTYKAVRGANSSSDRNRNRRSYRDGTPGAVVAYADHLFLVRTWTARHPADPWVVPPRALHGTLREYLAGPHGARDEALLARRRLNRKQLGWIRKRAQKVVDVAGRRPSPVCEDGEDDDDDDDSENAATTAGLYEDLLRTHSDMHSGPDTMKERLRGCYMMLPGGDFLRAWLALCPECNR